jgi:hypothetical protein
LSVALRTCAHLQTLEALFEVPGLPGRADSHLFLRYQLGSTSTRVASASQWR